MEEINHAHSGYGDGPDHPQCLRCHRRLKDPRWRKLGYGKKCYAKHCQEVAATQDDSTEKRAPADTDSYVTSSPLVIEPTGNISSKAEKRAALDAAFKEELTKENPVPTEAQKRAAEQRLLQDVDKALGGEEDGGDRPAAKAAEDSAEEPAEEETGRKKNKAPKGRAVVRPGAFSKKGGVISSGRDQ